ncbi:MAG: 50S ribosomal protein L23 [Elusimicrobia bacterium]|nr:50S ribosomal protein L23 [Elusimicrobiota bacterium]MBI3012347.1 50S ribosomal protein L23 [Elusimicrobiota bacterium]MBI4217552.1 50S ribosomal protein L23 [Elusimicrobiota bacterium]
MEPLASLPLASGQKDFDLSGGAAISVNEWSVIKSPLLTERSTKLKEKFNQVVFRVDPRANKGDIRRAVEMIFKVDVEKVRTAIFRGKFRRLSAGKPQGKRPDWKKAIVTIKKGQDIKMEQEMS